MSLLNTYNIVNKTKKNQHKVLKHIEFSLSSTYSNNHYDTPYNLNFGIVLHTVYGKEIVFMKMLPLV